MTKQAPTTLECGRDLLELVAQVSDGTPPADPAHQADCPYCQEALCRLRTATGQLRELAGEQVTVPLGLGRRVMAQLRRERGRVALGAGTGGSDTVADLVLTQIARRAARRAEGVQQCSVTVESLPDGSVLVAVHLVADLGPSLPELGEAVRAAVLADLVAQTGLAAQVTVAIEDVQPPG